MVKVGLTGNIGSGKTIIAHIFSMLGVPVFYADLEAKKQLEDEKTRKAIREIFGPVVFASSGEVLRPVLAEIVFNNPFLLDQLNKIIHPGVRRDYQLWCQQHAGVVYTLYEAAILFESGHYREMDKVICVTAPEQLRIKRVMERDQLTHEEVERRMANQWGEGEKIALSDYVIRNDESSMVITQVLEVHKHLVQSSKGKGQS
jgi:dephospho-CoA kinase